jgi:branched-chain amino acid aminotransferase
MAQESGTHIWMDGTLIPWADAKVHIITNAFHYGYNVFEGIRCYATDRGPAVFRLKEHIRRLFESAHIIGIKIPFTPEQIVAACVETIKANQVESCYIRPIAYAGAGGMSLDYSECPINVAIAVWFWGEYLGAGKLESGVRTLTSGFVRHHPNTHMTKAKAGGNYLLFQMAKAIAHQAGFDEAIMLDPNGLVAEGSVENIFVVRDGVILTPPLTYLLGGITRESIIRIVNDLGLPLQERAMSRDELYIADEVFFCGTGAEVTPVVEIDHRKIGDGKRGPMTQRLQERYFEVVRGKVPEYDSWLTYVR